MSNMMKAIMDQAAQAPVKPAPAAPAAAAKRTEPRAKPTPAEAERTARKSRQAEEEGRFYRPSRDGRKYIGGHFDPRIAKQLRLLVAEEETTTQAVLEEALDLLFVKKGKRDMAELLRQTKAAR